MACAACMALGVAMTMASASDSSRSSNFSSVSTSQVYAASPALASRTAFMRCLPIQPRPAKASLGVRRPQSPLCDIAALPDPKAAATAAALLNMQRSLHEPVGALFDVRERPPQLVEGVCVREQGSGIDAA